MGLVKCPECGKEISDKSNACIHCGFPLEQEKIKCTRSIVSLFEDYSNKGYLNGKVDSIYFGVVQEANYIKFEKGEIEGNNEIAKNIIDGLSLIPNRLGWADCKLYCELIHFDTLSTDTIIYFANKLYSVISMKQYYDDGSSAYCFISPFFYAEYMVLQYAPEDIKSKFFEILNNPFFGKQTGYDYIVSMYKQHGAGNTIHQIENINRSTQSNYQSLKCPICSSTNVKKITTANRLMSVATFGFASSKIGKQYECKNCKHKW